jgi:hypothetical protein
MNKNDIINLFRKFGAEISQDDVWQVQSAIVVKHKALERLAAAAKIEFDAPVMVRSERDEAVILVTGNLDGRKEWSIGEALVNVNYRVTGKMAAYTYAMAEKRAKDRVILKLAGLHGIYSEDEADDFKQTPSSFEAHSSEFSMAMDAMRENETRTELREWYSAQKEGLQAMLSDSERATFVDAYKAFGASLPEEAKP